MWACVYYSQGTYHCPKCIIEHRKIRSENNIPHWRLCFFKSVNCTNSSSMCLKKENGSFFFLPVWIALIPVERDDQEGHVCSVLVVWWSWGLSDELRDKRMLEHPWWARMSWNMCMRSLLHLTQVSAFTWWCWSQEHEVWRASWTQPFLPLIAPLDSSHPPLWSAGAVPSAIPPLLNALTLSQVNLKACR